MNSAIRLAPAVFAPIALAGVPGASREKGPAVEVPPSLPSPWRLSAGVVYRHFGGVEFGFGSHAPAMTLPLLVAPAGLRVPPVGDATRPDDRFYRDGFVRPDGGTAEDGTTWFWGYDGAGQITDGQLALHGTGTRTEVSQDGPVTRPSPSDDHELGDAGPYFQLDYDRPVDDRWSAGARFAFSLHAFEDSVSASTFSATQQSRQFEVGFTDRYDVSRIEPPEAPYQGTLEGPGALIRNLPERSRHEALRGVESARFFNQLSGSLDLTVATLSLGPTVAARIGPTSLRFSAGLALAITDWSADQQETLFVSRQNGPAKAWREWSDHAGGTDVLPGFYLEGAVSVPLTPRWSVSGFGRYDWSRKLNGTVGPSSFQVDLGGWSVGGLIGFTF